MTGAKYYYAAYRNWHIFSCSYIILVSWYSISDKYNNDIIYINIITFNIIFYSFSSGYFKILASL